ncbi:hypothetical protein [Rhizorhabdus argentea]|uniref:hypothetical protein n=1 Tax=Rhizorhabdus argentea TaxID=1387174 RepID=UPI0030EDCFAA
MKQAQLLYDWCFRYEGSSRSSTIIRIGLPILIWYRFGHGPVHGLPSYGVGWAILFYLSLFGMFFGIFSQLSTFVAGTVTLAAYYYLNVLHHHGEWAHHHTYLLALATWLLAFAPCGKSYSVDRWLAVRRAAKAGRPPPAEEGNLFALRLIALQMVLLYFFAFWDKMFVAGKNAIFYNFLNGSRLEQIFMTHYWGSGFHIAPWMTAIGSAMAITVAIVELLLPLLLVERLQKWLVIPGIGLHIAFYVLLPLETYSLTCILLYFAIFNANKVHAFIDALGPQGASGAQPEAQLAVA